MKSNLEDLKIIAAQQYALKHTEKHIGALTVIKGAWENGFEIAQKRITDKINHLKSDLAQEKTKKLTKVLAMIYNCNHK